MYFSVMSLVELNIVAVRLLICNYFIETIVLIGLIVIGVSKINKILQVLNFISNYCFSMLAYLVLVTLLLISS